MTYSIVARDPLTGHLGIAVASRFFAAGSMVPSVRGNIGAVASQAFVNPLYGGWAIESLSAGEHPEKIIENLTANDRGSMHRQIHMIDQHGRNAAFTGTDCIDWAGHRVAEDVSVAGNMLAGEQVVEQTLQMYQACADKPLVERLLLAMQAGQDAGGDKRGKQSAALVICHDQDYPWLDIRVDDNADPLEELRRLYAVAQERFLLMVEMMATRENPDGLIDRQEIDQKMRTLDEQRRVNNIKSRSHGTGQ